MSDIEIVASEETRRVSSRACLDLPVTDEKQEAFPELVRHEATIVEPSEDVSAVEDDPDDDAFLKIAVEASGDSVVSGFHTSKILGVSRDHDSFTCRFPPRRRQSGSHVRGRGHPPNVHTPLG